MDKNVKVEALGFHEVMGLLVVPRIEDGVGERLNELKATCAEVQFTLLAMVMASIVEQSDSYEEACAAFVGAQQFMTQYLGNSFASAKAENEVN